MRVVILGAAIALVASAACAGGSHMVSGYTRSNGTYVAPHMQTNPDSTRANNWSTQGNTNPYTGQEGTKPLYPTQPSYPAPTYTRPATPASPMTPRCYGYGC